jgi:hypothetical protein
VTDTFLKPSTYVISELLTTMVVVMMELLLMMTTTTMLELSSIKITLALMTIKTAMSMPTKIATIAVLKCAAVVMTTTLAMMMMTLMIVR